MTKYTHGSDHPENSNYSELGTVGISRDGHEDVIEVHGDGRFQLRNKILVWLNASPERQKTFIHQDDLKSEPPVDPLRYVFSDVIQAVKLAEASNDLEDYRTMKKLFKALKKAYPITAEEFENENDV